MSDQLDLLDVLIARPTAPAIAATPEPPQHLQPSYPWPNAHLRPPRPVNPLAGVSADSLAALAAIVLVDELPPVVPGALPRVAVDREGWHRAMDHRQALTLQQLDRTLTPADAEALAALNYINLQQVDWAPTGPIIVTAQALEHLQNARAGLRCAAMEAGDG